MRGDAIAVLLVLWALSRAGRAEAAPAAPGAAPAPRPTLPPAAPGAAAAQAAAAAAEKSPGVPQKTPQRATFSVWSMDTMRLFVREMESAGVDPKLALLGIAAASDFDPGFFLGANVGLAGVRRADLAKVGFPTGTELYSLPAEEQIPWIARVVRHRIDETGKTPEDIGDLAVLINPVTAKREPLLRSGAQHQAAQAEKKREYQRHAALLQRAQSED